MKGTARIIKIPESMKATYDLVDGKLVKKVNVSQKVRKKAQKEAIRELYEGNKKNVGVSVYIAIALCVFGIFTVKDYAVNGSARLDKTLNDTCQQAYSDKDFDTYSDFNCANR